MRWAFLALAFGLLCTGCADAALHAANGGPERFEPLSVASPGWAYRTADGSVELCVLMNVAPGAWPLRAPSPEAFEMKLASRDVQPELSVPYSAWRSRARGLEGGGREPGACGPEHVFRADVCLLTVELVNRDGATALDDQQLRVSDRDRMLMQLDLRGPEPDPGNPLFWPLVPVAYAGDAVRAVVSAALDTVALAIIAPVAVIALITYPLNQDEMEREGAEYEARKAAAREKLDAELARERRCPAEPAPLSP